MVATTTTKILTNTKGETGEKSQEKGEGGGIKEEGRKERGEKEERKPKCTKRRGETAKQGRARDDPGDGVNSLGDKRGTIFGSSSECKVAAVTRTFKGQVKGCAHLLELCPLG